MNTENIISEFKPIDYFIEKNKITLLFSENKILILDDLDDLDDKFMYSFFIDKKCDIAGLMLFKTLTTFHLRSAAF